MDFSSLPEVAFAGRSNVGKSSLINKLLNRKNLARTSASPGKTVTINFYAVPNKETKQTALHFADLPGYGFARVSKGEKERWRGLVEGYLRDKSRPLCLCLQLLDMRHAVSADDKLMLSYYAQSGTPYAAVLTKADKLKPRQRAEALDTIRADLSSDVRVVPFSAVTGEGTETVWELISGSVKVGIL